MLDATRVKTLDECNQFCVSRGHYAYGVECPKVNNGNFQIECQCYSIEAWTSEENILPLTDCMGRPTMLTVNSGQNFSNTHCTGPHLQNGKGTGGACRSMIRRTSMF